MINFSWYHQTFASCFVAVDGEGEVDMHKHWSRTSFVIRVCFSSIRSSHPFCGKYLYLKLICHMICSFGVWNRIILTSKSLFCDAGFVRIGSFQHCRKICSVCDSLKCNLKSGFPIHPHHIGMGWENEPL